MISKKLVFCFWIISLVLQSPAVQGQRRPEVATADSPAANPRLIVGVVVDQMRYDYLTRFWNHFGNDGFKRLVGQGFLGKNHHFNYAPTSTGPGHASVYTGATPSSHGIIGNNWFDIESGQEVYCASDNAVTPVGTASEAGKMSPHRLKVSTITDQLRMHTQMRGKVIAVAIKDRGSVLPAGHNANAAYWFHGAGEGKWVSSSYYMAALPTWVTEYNTSDKINQYRRIWDTERNIQTYVESGPDDNAFEGAYAGLDKPTFPYDIPALWNDNGQYDLLKETAFGINMTTDFALLALEKEGLGTDAITDFLAISYSSTDYIGHRFGVNSKEVQDAYIRLDLELGRLLKALDKQVGENGYTLFLTSDHGAMQTSGYLKAQRIPGDFEEPLQNRNDFLQFVDFTYGTTDIIRNISNHQIFLDHRLLASLDLNLREVQEGLAAELLHYPEVYQVYTAYQIQHQDYSQGIPYLLRNGYNQKLSGDVLWVPAPGYSSYGTTGSTHGSPHVYDTHVPLLLFGHGIKPGSTTQRTEIPDIAPTISVLLGIAFPNGVTGKPISAALE